MLGSGRDWTRAFWVEDASVTSMLQCLPYDNGSNSTFIKSIRLLLQDPKNDQSGYKAFALFLGLIWNFRLVRTPSHWESAKNQSLWYSFCLFWWSKISDFSITAMLFESLGLPRTVYQLEVWKYSEYSEGSEGHSELAKLASEGGLVFRVFSIYCRFLWCLKSCPPYLLDLTSLGMDW